MSAYVYFVLVCTPFPPLVLTMMLLSSHICYISLLRCNYACWDATITTSIWLVNKKAFVNDTLSSRRTENYYLENAYLFCRKLLSCSLAALKSRSRFWSTSHLVSENKSINPSDNLHKYFVRSKLCKVFRWIYERDEFLFTWWIC